MSQENGTGQKSPAERLSELLKHPTTKFEVDKLLEQIPKEPGIVPYSRVEDVIGVDHGTQRFVSVTNAWRKKLLTEFNILVHAEKSIGFHLLTANEQVIEGGGRMNRRITNAIRKKAKILIHTKKEELGEFERKILVHEMDVTDKMLRAAKDNTRKLALVLRKPETLPRLLPSE